jgi:predicted nicotinamide N-methyase
MPGYLMKTVDVPIGGRVFTMCVLADHEQFAADLGAAELAGISSATWPLFGQLWPSGSILAEHLASFAITGKRILEIGCGMALSSLVLHSRGADITASDHHPLAAEFLARNCRLNALSVMPYVDAHWDRPDAALGLFDLIVASDVLYERGHADSIALFIARHAKLGAEVLISDPGRDNAPRLRRLLIEQGFACADQRMAFNVTDIAPFRGRLLHFSRGVAAAVL